MEEWGEVHLIGLWWGELRGRDQLEDLGINGRPILKLVLKE